MGTDLLVGPVVVGQRVPVFGVAASYFCYLTKFCKWVSQDTVTECFSPAFLLLSSKCHLP